MNKTIKIFTPPDNCPYCGPDHKLHEIDEAKYGCDNCKNIFVTGKPEEATNPPYGKDKDGNPLYPEEIL